MFEFWNSIFSKRALGSAAAALGVVFAFLLRDWIPDQYRPVAVVSMAALIFGIHYFGILKPDEKFEQVYGPTMNFLCDQILGSLRKEWIPEQGAGTTFPLRMFVFKNRCHFWLIPVHQWNVDTTHPDFHICFFGIFARTGLVGESEKRGHALFSVKNSDYFESLPGIEQSQLVLMDECPMPKKLQRITGHVAGIACIPLQSTKRGRRAYLCIDTIDECGIPTLWGVYNTLTRLQNGAQPVLVQMSMYNS